MKIIDKSMMNEQKKNRSHDSLNNKKRSVTMASSIQRVEYEVRLQYNTTEEVDQGPVSLPCCQELVVLASKIQDFNFHLAQFLNPS